MKNKKSKYKTINNKLLQVILFLSFVSITCRCTPTQDQQQVKDSTLTKHSEVQVAGDSLALTIADSIMVHLGGTQAWQRTCCFRWNFFGKRRLWWDKNRQLARIEWIGDSLVAIVHIPDTTGKVWKNGQLVTHPDTLRMYLSKAVSAWINDSYWLFMPYKLKDPGVQLLYLGIDTTAKGLSTHVLQLTFEGVGETPHNKYHVYVDTQDYLVRQWDYFRHYNDTVPTLRTPWANWQWYGPVRLASDRGTRQLTEIAVYDTFPKGVFKDLSVQQTGQSQ